MINSHRLLMSILNAAVIICIIAAPMVASAQTQQLKENEESSAIAYTDCVTDWVGENLIASASPTEMAEGGHASCLAKLQEYEEAQRNALLSITPPGQEFRATEKAKALASDVREMTKNHTIRLIIETRSALNR